MRVTPARDEIATKLKTSAHGTIVYTQLVADLDTPVSAMIKLGAENPYSCLLESVEGGNVRGRFSVIAIEPDLIWSCTQDKAWRSTPDGTPIGDADDDPFASLRQLIDDSRVDLPDDLPAMAAGLFGYFGYEMVHHMDRIPATNPKAIDVDTSTLMRPSIVVIFDRLKDQMLVCTPLRKSSALSPEEAWDQAHDRLINTVEKLNTPLTVEKELSTHGPLPEYTSNMKKSYFMEMVAKAVEYIKSGDIFQVVLSQRFSVPFTLPAISLYRSLRRLNPSPFLIYFNMGDMALVGSSPEILVRLRNKQVTIRPIAGTRPRGKTHDEDQALADELIADTKERAEHLMLLDLGRNDTGRVSKPGTVRLVDSFAIERYSHVMHIASEVEGEIRDDLDTVDALCAGFPAGTVSGAPKIRAMEIIDELEPSQRGPYAGAAGYISADGDMDTCIVLRTAIVKDGMMHIQAGAGIVYDSQPEAEFQETVNKAMAPSY
ncbi:MAG: anthranilate synthase component I [Alphaproteobacteria bacterium]|nr:anthranilate synthase component I [Alphaproteobacteria bacterium]